MKQPISCPVCDSKDVKFVFKSFDLLYRSSLKRFPTFRCGLCHALFIFPQPSSREIQKFYPKTYYSYSSNSERGFFSFIKRILIESHFNPQKKQNTVEFIVNRVFSSKFRGLPSANNSKRDFLDVGCSVGQYVKILSDNGWNAEGIEIDQSAVNIAKKHQLNVSHNSFESVKLTKKYSCIRMWHVLEHLAKPNLIFSKLKKHLSPEGEILIAIPNSDSLAQRLFGMYWYNLDSPRHLINYSESTIKYLAKKHDLVLDEVIFASCGGFIGSISHFLNHKFRLKLDLINQPFLVLLFSPLDYIMDLLKVGDIIFLRIKQRK